MIAKLTGIIDSSGEDWLIVDVGGIGYLVFCSTRTLARCPAAGGNTSLLIETHVREDHIHLYGFADAVERDWFRLLTTVQGVGVKVALGILSGLAPDILGQAIAAADAAALTQAPGVGKKLAARIITELRDKVGGIVFGAPVADVAGGNVVAAWPQAGGEDDGGGRAASDAVSALVNLGYGRTEAFGAITQARLDLDDGAGLETLIKDGLTRLGGEAASR